jgi:hypothetical protein
MPISETYVTQYLLEASSTNIKALTWYENNTGYGARLHDLNLDLDVIPNRAGERICLTISWLPEKIHIMEPRVVGLFSRKYEDEEQERLSRLLRDLWATAGQQCAARERRTAEEKERIRQIMFRRLIGTGSGDPESEPNPTKLEPTL